MQNLTIIWWSDWFWKWLAIYIKNHFEKEVNITITWRNKEKLENLKNKYWFSISTENTKSVENADIIIFSAPISKTEEIIKKVCPFIKETSVVLDVTSIKTFPSETMQKYSKKWVLIIPTHPMFWPYVSTIAGQIFVLTAKREAQKDKRYVFLKNFLENRWAKIIETSPKEHDEMMAVVQWLTHFDMFVLAETIKRLDINIKKSMDFVSPIYKIMISSVARYMNQNPKLYSDIQIYNKEVLKVHKTFMNVTNDFNNFVKEKDEENFLKTVWETQKYFWEHSLEWQQYTDKIIYMIWNQRKKAKSLIWKNIEIEDIYEKNIISWKLEDFKENKLIINWKKYDFNCYLIKN